MMQYVLVILLCLVLSAGRAFCLPEDDLSKEFTKAFHVDCRGDDSDGIVVAFSKFGGFQQVLKTIQQVKFPSYIVVEQGYTKNKIYLSITIIKNEVEYSLLYTFMFTGDKLDAINVSRATDKPSKDDPTGQQKHGEDRRVK